jgi:hypothetical protein
MSKVAGHLYRIKNAQGTTVMRVADPSYYTARKLAANWVATFDREVSAGHYHEKVRGTVPIDHAEPPVARKAAPAKDRARWYVWCGGKKIAGSRCIGRAAGERLARQLTLATGTEHIARRTYTRRDKPPIRLTTGLVKNN